MDTTGEKGKRSPRKTWTEGVQAAMTRRNVEPDQWRNEHIKEISGVKGKPDIIDIIERKRLQCYGHVKRMPEERIPKLIMEWIPR